MQVFYRYLFIALFLASPLLSALCSVQDDLFVGDFMQSLPENVNIERSSAGPFSVAFNGSKIYESNSELHDAVIADGNKRLLLHVKNGDDASLLCFSFEGHFFNILEFDFPEEHELGRKRIFKILDVSDSATTCSLLVAWEKPVSESCILVYYAAEIWDLESKTLIRRVPTFRRTF